MATVPWNNVPSVAKGLKVVVKLFIDIGNSYCFGTGLSILMYKDVYQYFFCQFICKYKLTANVYVHL